MKGQNAYQEELKKLEQTSREIDRQLEALRAIPRYFGDDASEQALEIMRENQRQSLSVAESEPYFGRLDFLEDGTEEAVPLYIGKVGLEERSSHRPLVIDWRAPVASLFYSFTGGEGPAAYESPEGRIEGLVYLKRNLVIRKRILQRVVDSYTRGGDNLAVTDEFLLYRLGENKDNRLRDIVSTIQAEQDAIIRSAKNTALVIQGVAGSGKTTVALHRMAFLLYRYREHIHAERMIIFAPNRMFLDYISGVLPELGVGSIRQTTFAQWALERLEHGVELQNTSGSADPWFAIGPERPKMDDRLPGRLKGSLAFRNYLDRCLEQFERTFLPETDFEPWEGARLPCRQIREWFYRDYRHYPLAARTERLASRLKRWIGMELGRFKGSHRHKELKKKSSARLRAYLKSWPDCTPLGLYRQVFDPAKPAAFAGEIPETQDFRIPAEIRISTFRGLKKKLVQPEDLAPLVHLRNRLHGIETGQWFDHTVIDEAQDFSPFQVALLKDHTREGSFTILGDLSQGIYEYRGISGWNEFLEIFGEGKASFHTLHRSYRSTMEIIRFANIVLERSGAGFPQAVPVFRSGQPVRLYSSERPDYEAAVLDVVRRTRSGSATVALLARTGEESARWHAILGEAGMDAELILPGQGRYKGGLSVAPVYLAKGLEFDAVILVDTDENHYGAHVSDAKLLYVGCTRALHELHLMYSGKASPLIRDINPEFTAPGPGMPRPTA
jgi:DNA helicase-2/ATP-dependent DNA helicase PcrA